MIALVLTRKACGEKGLLFVAEIIDGECGGVDRKTRDPQAYEMLMIACKIAKDLKVRERIAVLANRRACDPLQSQAALKIHVSPESLDLVSA